MALKVIGAGLGRTGTLSLKYALEKLGYSKCYHMMELMQDPSRLHYWKQLENGVQPDYEQLFDGYEAAVDFPPCNYYKQLMEKYPDAKVILTLRDADKWYVSAYNTIYQHPKGFGKFLMNVLSFIVPKIKGINAVLEYAINAIWVRRFQNKFEDREFAKKYFNDWNAEVMRTVPAEKLLVFEAKDGWEPLCKFLGTPVPNEPYPRVNDSQEFNKRRRFFMKPKQIS